jgi:predicted transcriptional regulator of viral defense system
MTTHATTHTDAARPDHRGLWHVAEEQGGYFTSAQALTCNISRRMLSHYARTGRYAHIRTGLYRLRDFPTSRNEEALAGWLSVGADRAVISHETALDLYDLTDVIPNAVHVTVPRSMRWLHAPEGVAVHTTVHPPRRDDVTVRDGMRVTSPERTLLDVAELGTAPEQVIVGTRTALAQGLVSAPHILCRARDRGVRVEHLVKLALDDAMGAGSPAGVAAQDSRR